VVEVTDEAATARDYLRATAEACGVGPEYVDLTVASRIERAEAVTGPMDGTHIQVIVNGCVEFDQEVESIQFMSILHTGTDDGPPCQMQFSARYGRRRPDGTVET
jgi:hypothetical protein